MVLTCLTYFFLVLLLGYGSENSERDRSSSVDYQHCQRAGRKYSFRKRKYKLQINRMYYILHYAL